MTISFELVDIITWLIVGLVAGYLAKWTMSGSGGGLISSILIGIVGAILGGILAQLVELLVQATGFTLLRSIAVAFVGSIILLALIRDPLRFGRYMRRL